MDLLKQKLTPEMYECLVEAQVGSPSAIMSYSKNELADITKLNLSCIKQIMKESAAIVLQNKFGPATCLKSWTRIPTGCSTIDAITRGGISSNGIIEIVGSSGVGKTQFCLQIALTTQLSVDSNGLEKSVFYICTEDVFPAKRLKQLSEAFSQKYKKSDFEDNVFIEHAADGEQLKRCLFQRLPKLLSVRKIGLVVIDSIAGAFRSENVSRDYTDRSHDIISMALKLNRLADKHNFAIVCVNQVTDNLTAQISAEPCLGLTWANMIVQRFSISRCASSQVREFEVVFAPDLPNRSCKFVIASHGLIGTE